MCYSAMIQKDLEYLDDRFDAQALTDLFETYEKKSKDDPKSFHPITGDIYPGSYAPVVFAKVGHTRRFIAPMRYSVDPPAFLGDGKGYTSFNARKDNLQSPFWSEAFPEHRGALVIQGFREWVSVKDLLKAGVVTIDQVRDEFDKQSNARKTKIEASGKKYKPTPTELKDPRFRQIVIEFRSDTHEILVPVIFSQHKERMGFAIITDDPLPDILEAGHDRSPVMLSREGMEAWLSGLDYTAKELFEILNKKTKLHFTHRLAQAA